MNWLLAVFLFSVVAYLFIQPRIIINEEPKYFATPYEVSLYYLLLPGEKPKGKQKVLYTAIGSVVLKEWPNSMTPAELARARKEGEDHIHRRQISIEYKPGRRVYSSYDDRLTTEKEALERLKQFNLEHPPRDSAATIYVS